MPVTSLLRECKGYNQLEEKMKGKRPPSGARQTELRAAQRTTSPWHNDQVKQSAPTKGAQRAHNSLMKKKKQGALHIVKLESFNCLMTFDFVPSAILVIMSPCVSVLLARLEQYILD